jgi:hypothetical protein
MLKHTLTQEQWTRLPQWRLVQLSDTDYIVKVAGASNYKSKAVIRNKCVHLFVYSNERGAPVAYVLQIKGELKAPQLVGGFYVYLLFGDQVIKTRDSFMDDNVRLLALGSNYLFLMKWNPAHEKKNEG